MSEALRKGWCPGALRPMMARDGLLVRLRVTGGRLSSDQARAIAALASYYGSGLLDLSARANLQLRGVGEASLPHLQAALDDLHLLDADAEAEAVRNVIASPLAGCGGRFDIGPIVAALEATLSSEPTLRALPGKFGFLIDDGGEPSLAGIAADVRFDRMPGEEEAHFWIGLGGTRDHAIALGFCAVDEIVDSALWIARKFLDLAERAQPPARRMAALVDRLGKYQITQAFGVKGDVARPGYSGALFQRPPVGLSEDGYLGLGVPFGRLDHAMLRAAADLADRYGDGSVRLTPWRCVLLPGLREAPYADEVEGFIADPDDPRVRVAACVGMAGCERGTTPTHADADALAGLAERTPGSTISIHVSGCEKGCAKPSRAPLTLVGREGRYDIVQSGKPTDPPVARGLDLEAVKAFIASKASS